MRAHGTRHLQRVTIAPAQTDAEEEARDQFMRLTIFRVIVVVAALLKGERPF